MTSFQARQKFDLGNLKVTATERFLNFNDLLKVKILLNNIRKFSLKERSVLFKEMVPVYFENRMRHISTLCVLKAEICVLKQVVRIVTTGLRWFKVTLVQLQEHIPGGQYAAFVEYRLQKGYRLISSSFTIAYLVLYIAQPSIFIHRHPAFSLYYGTCNAIYCLHALIDFRSLLLLPATSLPIGFRLPFICN
jgi:hypothetical protein